MYRLLFVATRNWRLNYFPYKPIQLIVNNNYKEVYENEI